VCVCVCTETLRRITKAIGEARNERSNEKINMSLKAFDAALERCVCDVCVCV